MKSLIIGILCAFLLLIAAGCCVQTDLPAGTSAPESVDETTAAPHLPTIDTSVEQKPMICVSVPTITQTETAADGTVIFNYSFQNMSLIVPDPEVADAVIVDFLNRIDQTTANAESIRDAAQAAYTAGSAWNPYLCQIAYDPMRIDQAVLSLMGCYASYSGNPHPEASYVSINYDLLTGSVLRLDDILTDEASADTLCKEITSVLNAQKSEKYLHEGFEATVKERFAHGISNDESWYLSQNGLCFFFSPYEIAPYSSGVIIAEIPYQKLIGILDNAYFPQEYEEPQGTIFVEKFDNDKIDSFSQFSEVIINDCGNKFLLYTDKSVLDVRIETGSWSSDGTSFTPEHTVFAAYTLTPGDAVVVETLPTDTLPTLRLSYMTGSKTVTRYITLADNGSSPVITES